MIVSSLFSWLAQIRHSTVNYDCTVLEQRKFTVQNDVSINLMRRIHSLDNIWRPILQKRPYEDDREDNTTPDDESSSSDVECIDEAFAFLNSIKSSKSLTSLNNHNAGDDDNNQVILRHHQRKRHTMHEVNSHHRNALLDGGIIDDYLHLWECRSLPQIQHGKIERISSLLFNESCEELVDDTTANRMLLHVRNGDIGSSVVWWMTTLLLGCEDEPEFDCFEVTSYNLGKVTQFPACDNHVVTANRADKTGRMETDIFKVRDHVIDNCTKLVCNGAKTKIGGDEVVALEKSALIIKDHGGNLKRTIMENVIDMDHSNSREIIVKSPSGKAKLYIDKLHSPIGKNRKLLQIFFRKRLSREDLERRGIYKDEPIFGNTLEHLQTISSTPIPIFVKRCIEHLECMKNITSPGLYRTSGNAAIIQTIRFNVDSNRMHILETYRDDPDVLAGALKMFFRELKRSLISERDFERLVKIYRAESSLEYKFQAIGNEIQSYSEPYRETLNALSEHLLNVARYEAQNQMNIKALSICWGPSVISFLTDHTLRNGMIELIQLKNSIFELLLMSYTSSAHGAKFSSSMSVQQKR